VLEAIGRFADPSPSQHAVALAVAGLVGFSGNGNAAHIRTGAGRQLGQPHLVVDGNYAPGSSH
jgi:hypothetical protein